MKNTEKFQLIYDQIYDLLEPLLNRKGEISVKEAHLAVGFPYAQFRKVFVHIMQTMVEQKKAKKLKNGSYRILKPNNKYLVSSLPTQIK